MAHHSSNAGIVDNALSSLALLCATPAGRTAFMEAGGLTSVLAAMDSQTPLVRRSGRGVA